MENWELFKKVARGRNEEVKELLRDNKNVDEITLSSPYEISLASLAFAKSNFELCEFLMERGGTPDIQFAVDHYVCTLGREKETDDPLQFKTNLIEKLIKQFEFFRHKKCSFSDTTSAPARFEWTKRVDGENWYERCKTSVVVDSDDPREKALVDKLFAEIDKIPSWFKDP